MTTQVHSYVCGGWVAPGTGARPIHSAITGDIIAESGGASLDFADMLAHATARGAPALQAMTFHDRARMLKALATALNARKQELYELSYDTGATLKDHAFDIDGGIGTLFVFASKGRREMPDGQVYVDGGIEQLSRAGAFLGQHVCTPLQGSRCISTPSTSRSGACWKSWRRRCWPGCPRSSNRPPRPAM
jgi:oxepin-CoA hydrolase/3-oxo-5,6-dehydrosuberyl-CoA semialdehyde dehydrogenase